MTPTLRKRLLIGAAGLIGLLIVALLVAPSLIDLDARKAEVIAAVKKATGTAKRTAGKSSSTSGA